VIPSNPLGQRATRRTVLQASLAAAAVASVAGTTATAAPAAAVPGTSDGGQVRKAFMSPPNQYRAGFRWWWPHGLVDPAEIEREIDSIADAGFGLVEIADVHHSTKQDLDAAGHGWGTAPWRAAVEAALTRAAKRGLRVDMTIGPSWPAAVPTITADDPRATQEVAHGQVLLQAGTTYDAALPEPVVEPGHGVTKKRLLLVQAVRRASPPPAANRPAVLDLASVVDLKDHHDGEHLTWTAPATGEWVVLAYWQRGTGQQPERGPHTSPESWVVDHFSGASSRAIIDLWERDVLTKEIRKGLKKVGGNVFEDSLEFETDATLWTDGLLSSFEDRAGYDLRPYLPTLLEVNERYQYDFDTATSARVRADLNTVLSDLYLENHVQLLQRWAAGLGMGLRIQCYGIENDAIAHAVQLDVPESESLGFKNLDDYRILASGRDIAGRSVLSCEAACYAGGAYNTTWAKALGTLGSIMAGGVSQNVLHGYPYRDVPDVAWPGFAAFSPYDGAPGFGEAWGPRMPNWTQARSVGDYLARTQMILQTGRPLVDAVVFRQRGYTSTGIGARWFTNTGIPLGWSHGFVSAGAMDLVEPTLRDGRLYPEGPGYRVFFLGGDLFASEEKTIQLSAARRLLALAQQGLKVVVQGGWSQARAFGLSTPAEDAEVRALLAELVALPNVAVTTTEASIADGLAAVGVQPAVSHATSTLMHVHRVDGDTDYFYVANARHAENRRINPVSQDVWFTTTAADSVPYAMDAWSGDVRRLAVYERDGARVRVRVSLNPGEGTIVAFADPKWLAGHGWIPQGAVSTTADSVRFEGNQLVARSVAGGTLTTTLEDGSVVSTAVEPAPAAPAIASWTLEVEDWTPGAQPWQTEKTIRTFELTTLAAWTTIPGLQDVSGIGRYTTTIDLPASWTPDVGAELELGTLFDIVKVTVNGDRVDPRTPLAPRIDLGTRLRPGANTITIELPTTLFNRLRTTNPSVFGSSSRQTYGLTSSVSIKPYREGFFG
jgi:hypothetical protein